MTTLKKYTLTDLKDKKIAVKLRNYEEYKRLCEAVGDKDDEELYFIKNEYYGFKYDDNVIYILENVYIQGRILLKSIDEIDLEEKEEVGSYRIVKSESTINYIQRLESEIARLKEENEELKDHVTNLKNANGAFAEKILKQKEEIQQLESPALTERTRMAWEYVLKSIKNKDGNTSCIGVDNVFEYVDDFLAKSKEVGNGN